MGKKNVAKAVKKPKNRTRGSGRPPGRPRKPVIGPEQLRQIADLYLLGNLSINDIAAKFGVTDTTIRNHLDAHIRPAWRERFGEDLDAERAKIAWIESKNIEMVQSGERKDLQDARWAVEQRLKIAGSYAAEKHQHQHEISGEVRVAGEGGPGALADEFVRRLAAKVADVQAYQAERAKYDQSKIADH